jgi:hypothetical protein
LSARIAVLLAGIGVAQAARVPPVVEREVVIPGLPPAFEEGDLQDREQRDRPEGPVEREDDRAGEFRGEDRAGGEQGARHLPPRLRGAVPSGDRPLAPAALAAARRQGGATSSISRTRGATRVP